MNLEKKIDIPKHHLPSCSTFPENPKIDFNSATRLQCLIRVHVLENTKRSFVALRPSILLLLFFLFFLTFYLELCTNSPQFKEEEIMYWKIRADALVTQFPSFNNLGYLDRTSAVASGHSPQGKHQNAPFIQVML